MKGKYSSFLPVPLLSWNYLLFTDAVSFFGLDLEIKWDMDRENYSKSPSIAYFEDLGVFLTQYWNSTTITFFHHSFSVPNVFSSGPSD